MPMSPQPPVRQKRLMDKKKYDKKNFLSFLSSKESTIDHNHAKQQRITPLTKEGSLKEYMDVINQSNQSLKTMIDDFQKKISIIENKQQQVFKIDPKFSEAQPTVKIGKVKLFNPNEQY